MENERPSRRTRVRQPFAAAAYVLAGLLAPLAAYAQAPAAPAAAGGSLRVSADPRPSLRVGDMLHVDLRLALQADFVPPAAGEDRRAFTLHRRRVGVKGQLLNRIDFEFAREIDAHRPWRDAYVNLHLSDLVEARVGQFKIPFGLDATTGLTELAFIRRTLASSAFAPGRSRGVMLHGTTGRVLAYEAGVFGSDGDNARPADAAYDGEPVGIDGIALAGRVILSPVGSVFGSRPRIGAAITTARVRDGLNSVRVETLSGADFLPRMYTAGRRARAGLQAAWKPGPFAISGEWIAIVESRDRQGLGDEDLPDLRGRSWHLVGAWMIAGDRKRSGVEVASRIERLRYVSGEESPVFITPRAEHIPAHQARVWTSGATWFVNRWVRLQGNAAFESYAVGGAGRRTWRGLVRTQVVL